MRMDRLAKMLIGVEDVVVEGVGFDDGRQAVVIDARPRKPQGCRFGRCGRNAEEPKCESPSLARRF